ncbi:MFS transporter [Actinomadura rubrisoli]|uniref:MFS transporter n=1 Tax=Actinomadura rubrisoli TaxID=2530368 RepID=A0A4R5B5L8_9ACTN|nr:MFS transporter [Actinomadura rubrisoli]TDD80585.1 MFS transporter [Actinomadura rubrisoli]
MAPVAVSEREFRRYAVAQQVSVIGLWIHSTALPWLVLDLTRSAAWMGVVVAVQFAPMLLAGLYGGLIVDRYDRRLLLAGTQILPMALSAVLGVFLLLGRPGPADLLVVVLVALGFGVTNVVDDPARSALLLDLAGREGVRTKVVVTPLINDIARAVGPLIAGVLIQLGGMSACFLINAATYVPVLAVLAGLRVARGVRRASGGGQIRDGLRYAASDARLRAPLVMITIVGTLTFEFVVTFPILVRETLRGGPLLVSGLFLMFSIGSVLAALTRRRWTGGPPRRLAAAALAFGAAVMLFALSWAPGAALVLVVGVGATSVVFLTLGIAHVQQQAAPAYIGRVMALWGIGFNGTTALGSPVVGWVGEHHGGRWPLLVGAAAAGLAGLYGWIRLAAPAPAARVRMDGLG